MKAITFPDADDELLALQRLYETIYGMSVGVWAKLQLLETEKLCHSCRGRVHLGLYRSDGTAVCACAAHGGKCALREVGVIRGLSVVTCYASTGC